MKNEGSLLDEALCRGEADAARTAGDHGHLAGEVHASAGMTSLAISSSAASSR
jgi:hypothetical protein